MNADWLHIKGIEVTGVQVTIVGHTQPEYFKNDYVHSSLKGAHLNDQSVVNGLRELPDVRIKSLLKEPK